MTPIFQLQLSSLPQSLPTNNKHIGATWSSAPHPAINKQERDKKKVERKKNKQGNEKETEDTKRKEEMGRLGVGKSRKERGRVERKRKSNT